MDLSLASIYSDNLVDLVQCFVIAVTLTPILAGLKRAILGDNRLVLLRIA